LTVSLRNIAENRDALTLLLSWIAGPSARGSVKGTPSSITSAPPASIASITSTVLDALGYPAVMNVTNTGTFCHLKHELSKLVVRYVCLCSEYKKLSERERDGEKY
jgi:hypothetical protein